MQLTRKSVLAMCAIVVFTGAARAQTGSVLITDEQTLKEIDPRIVITPGEGEWQPISTTAVVTISTPGSYVLGGNVQAVGGKHGIEITVSNVTLDLNGYSLEGSGVQSRHGITATTKIDNIRITNGAINGWKWRGIDAGKMLGVSIDNVNVTGSKGPAVVIKQGSIVDSQIRNNLSDGVQLVDGESIVMNCAASGNGGDGFVSSDGVTFKNCTSARNVNGFNTGSGCVLEGCSAIANTGSGILTVFDSIITNCASRDNAGAGIDTGNSCHVVDSTASRNGLFGIAALQGSTVRDCTVSDHNGNGMYGIGVSNNVRLVGNNLSNNTYGLFVTGNNCWLDGNNIANANTGVYVTGTNNLITRNVVTGIAVNGAGFNIAGGNDIGTVRPSPNGSQPFDNIQY